MQKREVNICVFDWTWHLFNFLWMVQHLVFWRATVPSAVTTWSTCQEWKFSLLKALLWIKQLPVRFQRAASSLVITLPKSRCEVFHSLLFISEVFHSLLQEGFVMVNRLKALSLQCGQLYVCLPPSLFLLYRVRGKGGECDPMSPVGFVAAVREVLI